MGAVDGGLVHSDQGRRDVFTQTDGLSSNTVEDIFEDRERNIWVATSGGLDRFRELAVTTLTAKQSLSGDRVVAVLAAGDGSVWIGTVNGLTTVPRTASGGRDRTLGELRPNALFQDARARIWVSTQQGIGYLENGHFVAASGVPGGGVRSIAEDAAGNLWIANQDRGLFRVSPAHDVQQIPWARLGHEDFALTMAAEPLRGGLWLGFFQGGIAYVADGQVRASYAAADGLGEGFVADVRLDQSGALWAATERGLSRVKDGRVATLTSKSGLPCDTVHWSIEDDARSVWLYMACGLGRIARPELDAWAAAVDKSDKDAKPTIHPVLFDSSDGVGTLAFSVGYSPKVAKSTDERLWFLPGEGVSVIDPGHLILNNLPQPIHLEQIIADLNT
jgi:ligand-binding sensor domain-containing protein